MAWLREVLVRLGWGGGIDRLRNDVHEELLFHLERRAEANMRAGMPEEEAWKEARRAMGDVGEIEREGAEILAGAPPDPSPSPLGGMGQDVRFAFRRVARTPWLSLTTVLVLALGLSTATAVFTYLNGFFQPFPGADARDLYQLFLPEDDGPWASLSYPDYLDLASAELASIDPPAADYLSFGATVRFDEGTEVLFGQAVTGNYFEALGVRMALGRGYTAEDDAENAPPSVIISWDYFAGRLGGREEVLGQTLFLNGNPYTIVGVVSPEFRGSSSTLRPDAWLTFGQFKVVYWARSTVERNRDIPLMRTFVRLRSSPEKARAELAAFAAGLDAAAPREAGPRSFHLEPATWIGPAAREAETPANRLMLVATLALLLLACANVANLLLAMGARRHHELAVRAAQGATPFRLGRQLLTENLLLVGLAGVVAVVLAGPVAGRIGSYFVRPSVWGATPSREVAPDLRVFVFAFGLSVLVGLLVGLVPALRGSRQTLTLALKDGTGVRGKAGRRILGWRPPGSREGLVTIQVALAVVLLVVSGLVLRTLASVQAIDPGFRAHNVIASYMSTSSTDVTVDGRVQFYRELVQRFQELPWVEAATLAAEAPLSPHPASEVRVGDDDRPTSLTVARVVPGFFEAFGMRAVRGRLFEGTDTVGGAMVAIVNETLAERFFPNGDAVGRQLWWPGAEGEAEQPLEIVGIANDARVVNYLAPPEPVVYLSYPQHYYTPGNSLLLVTTIDARSAVPLLQKELRAVDPRLALVNALPYDDVFDGFSYAQRMNAELFSLVALMGLALAAAGIFAVVSLAVTERTREIGLRVAVGAQPGDVIRVVSSRAGPAVASGVVLGVAASLLLAPLVQGLLVTDVAPHDPMAMSTGVVVLLVSAFLATWLPTRRALRVDPAEALRAE